MRDVHRLWAVTATMSSDSSSNVIFHVEENYPVCDEYQVVTHDLAIQATIHQGTAANQAVRRLRIKDNKNFCLKE